MAETEVKSINGRAICDKIVRDNLEKYKNEVDTQFKEIGQQLGNIGTLLDEINGEVI